ncbi:unnamed protein product, partial [Brassica rapa]
MENHLCFDPGTTPTTPLSTDIQKHCEKLDLINSLPEMFVKISSQDVKSFGFDHLEKSFELVLQQPNLCFRKPCDSFVWLKDNGFYLSFSSHELITGNLVASTCVLDKFMVKTLLEHKSPRVKSDFCDSVLKLDSLCVETDKLWHNLRSILKNCVVLSFDVILVYNTFFEKYFELLISDSQSELNLLCSDFEKAKHDLKLLNIISCFDTILVCNAYFHVHFERLKCELLVLRKETLFSDLNKYI